MCFRDLNLSGPTGFPTTNGKAMNTMIYPTIHRRRMSVGFRGWCWVVAMLFSYVSLGCARVTPTSELSPSDLQVTADSLKTAVQEAQRTAAALRTELDAQRKELANAQLARAQLQGMLQETERRLADARQIIELQREELTEARSERERLAQAVEPRDDRPRQSTIGAARRKSLPVVPESVAQTSIGKGSSAEQAAALSERTGSVRALPPEGETGPGSSLSPSAGSATALTSGGEPQVGTIVVRRGDTLWAIARRHRVGVNALRSINGLSGDRILVGRTLRLPEPQL